MQRCGVPNLDTGTPCLLDIEGGLFHADHFDGAAVWPAEPDPNAPRPPRPPGTALELARQIARRARARSAQ
jgi:hypothetical protein